MNETTASIAGREIADLVIARYYPELVPPPALESPENPAPKTAAGFQTTFRLQPGDAPTRVTVDRVACPWIDRTGGEIYGLSEGIFLGEKATRCAS